MNHALDTRTPRLAALLRAGLVAAVLAVGAGCAGNDEQETVVNDIAEAYQTAKTSVERGNYTRGIQIYEAILARYPFSELSGQLQLDLMFAYYKAGRTEEAVETADTFMRENPISESVDYALYVKGLANFEDEAGFLERRFKKDVTARPPEGVDEAYSSFRRLVERYPASQYAADAEQRMVFLKNRLADYENNVAVYYLRRGGYVAELNRERYALEDYYGAPANAESLRIMERAYKKLGLTDLAADARRVRELNFPEDS